MGLPDDRINSKETLVSSLRTQFTKLISNFTCSAKRSDFQDKVHFDYLIKHSSSLIVVNFTATWCKACKQSEPKLKQLKEHYSHANVVFLEIDIDQNDDISEDRDVTSIPTYLFFFHGRELHRVNGFNEKSFASDLEKLLKTTKRENWFDITSKEKFSHIIEQTRGLVIFWATANWCGGCQKISPQVHEYAKKYNDVTFCKVDVDDCDSVSSHLGVSKMPSFFFFRDGKLVSENTGGSKLKHLIEKYRKPLFHNNEIIVLSEKHDLERALQNKKKLIGVYFFQTYKKPAYNTDVKMMKFADYHTNITIYKFDVQDKSDIRSQFGLSQIPTFILYVHGSKKHEYPFLNIKVLKDIHNDIKTYSPQQMIK